MCKHTCSVCVQRLPAQDKNKYLPLVGFWAEMWRMRKCWCVCTVGDGLQPVQHVGRPRSLCTLPVFLWQNHESPLRDYWSLNRAVKVTTDTNRLTMWFSSESGATCLLCDVLLTAYSRVHRQFDSFPSLSSFRNLQLSTLSLQCLFVPPSLHTMTLASLLLCEF